MHSVPLGPPKEPASTPLRRAAPSFETPNRGIPKRFIVALAASTLLVGCATSPRVGKTACEYRLVRGVTDPGGLPDFERNLNAAAKEGFTIISTTVIPRTADQREQTLIILERPVR